MNNPNIPMYAQEVALAAAAMQWAEDMWPFDPEAGDVPPSRFPAVHGEILPPKELEVSHFDGYRVGWIRRREDNQWVFVRDYEEVRSQHAEVTR